MYHTLSFFEHTFLKKAYFLISLFSLSLLLGCKDQTSFKTKDLDAIALIRVQFSKDISSSIIYLDSIQSDFKNAKDHYKKSRLAFKYIEPILSTLDVENYNFLNQPNILKIEEEAVTDIKIKKPSGYQVLEEALFAEQLDTTYINKHVTIIQGRLKLIQKNASFKHLKKYHFLWLFRKAIIRIALTGITGFDSPVLSNSLAESKAIYQRLQLYLSYFEADFESTDLYRQWNISFEKSMNLLHKDFDSFDRYTFIKSCTHQQLQLWNATIKDWHVTFPFELAIKNDAASLFSQNTFNMNYFGDPNYSLRTEQKVLLGKKLFYDPKLSGKETLSCASCHLPEKAFTDGLPTSPQVTRNSPTLLYAALQKGFFYDRRAGSLEGQIIGVIENEKEFHTDLKTLEKKVVQDSSYDSLFKEAYPKQILSQLLIRNAIATYIRSLTPFNSKFDRNINDLENSLTTEEIHGFNLFTGKAQCATCHFAPLFNGTVPPDYKESELELIGVPQQKDTLKRFYKH